MNDRQRAEVARSTGPARAAPNCWPYIEHRSLAEVRADRQDYARKTGTHRIRYGEG